MNAALFNPPTPKNWIYIIIIASCLLLITILNSCKTRHLEKESSKLIDKSEQFSAVTRKDSVNNVFKKTENIDITEKRVQKTEKSVHINDVDSGLTVTEKTKTVFFDTLGNVKSIFETVKITDKKNKKVGTLKTGSDLFNIDKLDKSNINIDSKGLKLFLTDSTGTKKNDINKLDESKKLDAKKESSTGWMVFGIVLVLGAVFLIWKLKY